MIECQNCGAENLMTSIFCHSCGAKLDLDAAAPEEKMQEEEKSKKKKKIIGRMITGFVVLIVLGFVACFFIPSSVQKNSLSANQRENIKTTWEWLKKDFDRKEHGSLEVPMSPGKASWVLNRVIDPDPAEKVGDSEQEAEKEGDSSEKAATSDSRFQFISPPKGYLQLRDDNYLRLVLRTKILRIIPFDRFVVFKVMRDNGGSISAETTSAKIGIIPLPGPLKEWVGGWIWQTLSQNSDLTELQKDVRDVIITSGQLVVVTKAKPKGVDEGTGHIDED